MTKPFTPIVTLEQVFGYVSEDPATHTQSPLVNAVAEVLSTTKIIECKEIARALKVDERKLSNALSLELGMSLKDLLVKYRSMEVQEFKQQHPEYTTEELAHAIGYSSAKSISRFLDTNLGITPAGHKSHREKDKGVRIRSELRAIQRMNLSPEETIKRMKEVK